MSTITISRTGPTIIRLTLVRADGTDRSVPFNLKHHDRIIRLLTARGWVFTSWCDMRRETIVGGS